jgi:hypothetical protein
VSELDQFNWSSSRSKELFTQGAEQAGVRGGGYLRSQDSHARAFWSYVRAARKNRKTPKSASAVSEMIPGRKSRIEYNYWTNNIDRFKKWKTSSSPEKKMNSEDAE